MLTLALLGAALASPPFEPLPPLGRPELAAAARKGGGGGKKQSKAPGWRTTPTFSPRGGVRVLSQNGQSSTVATVGADLGYSYRYVDQGWPQWRGASRLSADLVANAGSSSGMELRGGSFMGPHWKLVGVESGLDLFWNRWSFGGQTLDPSLGAELPLRAMFHQKGLSGYAGVAAAWLAEPSRRVDWSQQSVPGFGHEFAYMAGASGRLAGVEVGLAAELRVTALGPVSSARLSLGVDDSSLQELIDLLRGASGGGDSNQGSEKR